MLIFASTSLLVLHLNSSPATTVSSLKTGSPSLGARCTVMLSLYDEHAGSQAMIPAMPDHWPSQRPARPHTGQPCLLVGNKAPWYKSTKDDRGTGLWLAQDLISVCAPGMKGRIDRTSACAVVCVLPAPGVKGGKIKSAGCVCRKRS